MRLWAVGEEGGLRRGIGFYIWFLFGGEGGGR